MIGWLARGLLVAVAMVGAAMLTTRLAENTGPGRPSIDAPRKSAGQYRDDGNGNGWTSAARIEEPGGDVAVVRGSRREIAIDLHRSGHFKVAVQVNGAEVPFIVDTGASKVILTRRDAEKIGIDPAWLNYSERYWTANGQVRAAPVELDEMRLGDIEIRGVAASVNEADMPVSLLGMTFLDRLDGYEVKGERLILKW